MKSNPPEIETKLLADDGRFPNNPHLPLTVARQLLPADSGAEVFEDLFRRNGWMPAWRAGIFDFDHYHSSAHEVLGCFRGSACLQFGGAQNYRVSVQAGDAVVIPAGVAHRCLKDNQFLCVGAYPLGQSWDTCTGQPSERPDADQRILSLGPWESDPF
ncbi:MAG: cupin domain-containing protein [Burkholderiaceae bacterium]